jgi:SPOR domain
VSAVETPPPDQQPTGRRCPRCGAAMSEEQEWCLACGAAVGTRVVSAPGWRGPIVLAAVIVVVAAIAVAIAIVQLADDTDQVAQNPPAAADATTPPVTTPAPTVTPDASGATPDSTTLPEASGQETPEPTTTPEPTSTPESTAGADVASWPSGKSGWTVVLASKSTESEANDDAEQFANSGISGVGVLNSDGFSSLKPGFWVVYAGEYDSQSAASDALDGIDAQDAYIRQIVPN